MSSQFYSPIPCSIVKIAKMHMLTFKFATMLVNQKVDNENQPLLTRCNVNTCTRILDPGLEAYKDTVVVKGLTIWVLFSKCLSVFSWLSVLLWLSNLEALKLETHHVHSGASQDGPTIVKQENATSLSRLKDPGHKPWKVATIWFHRYLATKTLCLHKVILLMIK